MIFLVWGKTVTSVTSVAIVSHWLSKCPLKTTPSNSAMILIELSDWMSASEGNSYIVWFTVPAFSATASVINILFQWLLKTNPVDFTQQNSCWLQSAFPGQVLKNGFGIWLKINYLKCVSFSKH